jgi:uncharacterized protein
MLSFAIRTLSQGALQVDDDLSPDDAVWLEDDVRPVSGVRVTGRLSEAGSGRYYFSGAFTGIAAGECRRCLTPVETPVTGEAHFLYTDADDENADEPDVFPLAERGSMLDLRPAIREQWLLEVTSLPLCRPECKGFCATCGADLNVSPCDCARSSS